MTYAASEWLNRHKFVSEEKILTIVRHKSGRMTENEDGTITIETKIIHQGNPLSLFIKILERARVAYDEVLIIKIHLGYLNESVIF
jgi:hypothetical protein